MRGKERLTGHENAWHVLVAARNDNHSIEVVTTSGSLDLISNQVAGLEGVGHAACAHADTVADANSAKLVPNDVRVCERGFYLLTKTEEVLVTSFRTSEKEQGQKGRRARVSFIPYAGYTDHGLVKVVIRVYAIRRVKHGLERESTRNGVWRHRTDLTGALVFRLGDDSAVAIEDGFT